MLFVSVVTPCGLVGGFPRFGGTYYLHPSSVVVTPCGLASRYKRFRENMLPLLYSGRWRQYVLPKRWYLPTSPHAVTSQRNNIDMFTVVRT
jgi:hypothetical protein